MSSTITFDGKAVVNRHGKTIYTGTFMAKPDEDIRSAEWRMIRAWEAVHGPAKPEARS